MLVLKANVNTLLWMARIQLFNREKNSLNTRQVISIDWEGTRICVHSRPSMSGLTHPSPRPTPLFRNNTKAQCAGSSSVS